MGFAYLRVLCPVIPHLLASVALGLLLGHASASAQTPSTRTFDEHNGAVLAVAYSPEGTQALSGSQDGVALMWTVANGVVSREFNAHEGAVNAVAFAPNGLFVVTGSADDIARWWDLSMEEPAIEFSGHTDAVTSVAVSSDSLRVVTGSEDGTARLWTTDAEEEVELLRTFDGGELGITDVAISADGLTVVTASRDREVRLWNAETGMPNPALEHPNVIFGVALSPNALQVAGGGGDNGPGIIKLWDVVSGEEQLSIFGDNVRVLSVDYSPDGSILLSGGTDRSVSLFDTVTGESLQRFEEHTDQVTSVAYSPIGNQVMTGSLDRSVKLWPVDIEPIIEGSTLSGRVERTSGAGIDCAVVVTDGSGTEIVAVTDVNGGYLVEGLEPNTYLVTAYAAGREVVTDEVVLGEMEDAQLRREQAQNRKH